MADITLAAVGDLLIRDENPAYLFDSAREVLHGADIAFANCEQPYAWRYPDTARAFKAAGGFHVMNFANNHILDHGPKVFLDTIEQIRAADMAVIGAGADIAAARAPAIVERDGTRIAFLGYSSIQAPSYEATAARAGFAPMKAHTAYHEQFAEAPGTPARIRTFADAHDLEALVADIKAAKAKADVVVMSIHWGPLLKGSLISEYQPVVAHAAVDAGADLVLGHHPHILKGVEVYKGKVIFYSINHFIMKNDKPLSIDYASHGFVTNAHIQAMLDHYPGEFGFYEDYPLYPFGPETLNTMVVHATIRDGEVHEVGYLPCRIGTDYQPKVLRATDPQFAEVVGQVERYSRQMNLASTFAVEGDRVRIAA